jgi:hypothetical protein
VLEAEVLPLWCMQSAAPGTTWPTLPAPGGATVLALLFNLDRSRWLPLDQLRERQLRQLQVLVRHALATVPYYRERWANRYDAATPLTFERFAELPLLTRHALQGQFENLKSSRVPAGHGGTRESQSSGSTGMPVRILKTQLSGLFWNAFTLRDHAWHRRDLRGKLATIRHGIPAGEFEHWGQATAGLVAYGPSVVIGVHHSVQTQLRWLEEQQPDYLMTYPSIAAELAKLVIAGENRIPPLRELRTLRNRAPLSSTCHSDSALSTKSGSRSYSDPPRGRCIGRQSRFGSTYASIDRFVKNVHSIY